VSKYPLRLLGYPDLLGAQAQIDWNGKRYAIDSEPKMYNGSRRTRHTVYIIARK
jgi:hypothetical protein